MGSRGVGLDWIGLGRIESDGIRLDQNGSDVTAWGWTGSEWIGLDQMGPRGVGMDRIGIFGF